MFWREYVHVQTAKKAAAYTTLLWSGATYPLPSAGPDLSQNYSLHFGNILKSNHATRNAKRISWCSTAKIHSNSSTEITERMKVPSISEVTPQQSDATTLPYISIINTAVFDEWQPRCWTRWEPPCVLDVPWPVVPADDRPPPAVPGDVWCMSRCGSGQAATATLRLCWEFGSDQHDFHVASSDHPPATATPQHKYQRWRKSLVLTTMNTVS